MNLWLVLSFPDWGGERSGGYSLPSQHKGKGKMERYPVDGGNFQNFGGQMTEFRDEPEMTKLQRTGCIPLK